MTRNESHERVWARLDRTQPLAPSRKFARNMRAQPTDAEQKLWWHLRYRLSAPQTHFRRQVRFGTYIVDFACHGARLIVELDGGQHAMQIAKDAMRTKFLESKGYRVLRYWNNDVLTNIDGVLADIANALATTPTPNPSPQGGGEPHRPHG